MDTSIRALRETLAGDVPTFEKRADFYRFLLRYAVLAPSTMNTQPWLFRVDEEGLDVEADRSRQLRALDGSGREMIISCGAALANAEAAARCLGTRMELVWHGYSASPGRALARLQRQSGHTPKDLDLLLFHAIRHRHTVRKPFEKRGIGPGLMRKIMDQAEMDGVSVTAADEEETRSALAGSALELMEQLAGDSHRAQEAARWRAGWNQSRRDGVPQSALSLPPHEYLWLYMFGGHTAVTKRARNLLSRRVLDFPRLLVLATRDDQPQDWLWAGYAMEFALLRAAAYGIQASFMGCLINTPAARARTQSILGLRRIPQMVIGLGHASSQPVTPRRPLDDVLVR